METKRISLWDMSVSWLEKFAELLRAKVASQKETIEKLKTEQDGEIGREDPEGYILDEGRVSYLDKSITDAQHELHRLEGRLELVEEVAREKRSNLML